MSDGNGRHAPNAVNGRDLDTRGRCYRERSQGLSNELISARSSCRRAVLASVGSVSMCSKYLALVADENILDGQQCSAAE